MNNRPHAILIQIWGALFVAPSAFVVLGLLVLYEDFLVLKGTVAVPAHGLVHPLLLASHPLGHNKKGNTKINTREIGMRGNK